MTCGGNHAVSTRTGMCVHCGAKVQPSHDERIAALEETVAKLEARINKLEAATRRTLL